MFYGGKQIVFISDDTALITRRFHAYIRYTYNMKWNLGFGITTCSPLNSKPVN